MPRNDPCARFALMSQMDVSQWAGVNVFDRGAANITLPASFDRFADAVDFLNDRGSVDPLADLLQTATDAAPAGPHGTWVVSIDEDDRVYFENDTSSFSLNATAANAPLGFSTASAQIGAVTGATWTATAPSDWTRGEFVPSSSLSVTIGGDTVLFGYRGQIQDVPVYLRADTLSLQDTDNTAAAASGLTRWGVDSDGRVFCSYLLSATGVSWVEDDFRDRLGFSGTETPLASGGYYVLTADYPLPGALFPTRPADSRNLVSEDVSTAASLTDGTIASNYVATHQRVSVVAWLDGPADSTDLHRHWHYECRPYLHRGAPCVLYQDWGDSRLALWRPTGYYSTTYTGEPSCRTGDAGYHGRIEGYMASGSAASYESRWPQRIVRRAPLSFVVQGEVTRAP